MIAQCVDTGGMNAEELHRETLAIFGGRRLTAGITDRLTRALAIAERDGRLANRGGIYQAC